MESPSAGQAAIATWYGADYAGGPLACSGEPFAPDDATVAAVQPGRWPCGTRLVIGYGGKQVTVYVLDHCPGCGWNHVDLSKAAFERLAPLGKGVITVTIAEVVAQE